MVGWAYITVFAIGLIQMEFRTSPIQWGFVSICPLHGQHNPLLYLHSWWKQIEGKACTSKNQRSLKSIILSLQVHFNCKLCFIKKGLYAHYTPNVIFVIICIAFIKIKQKKLCPVIFGIDADTQLF